MSQSINPHRTSQATRHHGKSSATQGKEALSPSYSQGLLQAHKLEPHSGLRQVRIALRWATPGLDPSQAASGSQPRRLSEKHSILSTPRTNADTCTNTDPPAITASSEVAYCTPLAGEGSSQVSGSLLSIFHFQPPCQIHDFTFSSPSGDTQGSLSLLVALLASRDSLCSGAQAPVMQGPAHSMDTAAGGFMLRYARETRQSRSSLGKRTAFAGLRQEGRKKRLNLDYRRSILTFTFQFVPVVFVPPLAVSHRRVCGAAAKAAFSTSSSANPT